MLSGSAEYSQLSSPSYRLRPIPDLELLVDSGRMPLDCSQGDEYLRSDLFVRLALCYEIENFGFSRA
jgi:hypothetical protein